MGLLVDIKKQLPGFNLDVSFHSDKDSLGFLGASGSGKSLTLRCIAGLMTPDEGKIIIDDCVFFDSKKGINVPISERKTGYVFQNYALFKHMTVEGNIAFGLRNRDTKYKVQRTKEMLELVRLEGYAKSLPHELSGGQQQRVALARALAFEPNIILLDEPFSALDSQLRNEMEYELLAILSNYQGASIFVTHNIEEAYRISKEIVIFKEGKTVEQGSRDKVFYKPETHAAAVLTGCSNLSQIKIKANNEVEAVNWKCRFKVNKDVPENTAYVGMRPSHLRIVDKLMENTYPAWLAGIKESPYTVILYLYLHENPKMQGQKWIEGQQHIEMEVSRDLWKSIKDKEQPWLVHFNCADFLFLG